MFAISFGDPNNQRQHLSRWEFVYGGNVAALAKVCCKHTYSASIWCPTYRLDRNFRCANLLVLDFDEGVTLEEIKHKMIDKTCCIAPTRNHQKDKGDGKGKQDRFRLICELEHIVWDLNVYKHTARTYATMLGADPNATSGAQAWRISKEIAHLQQGEKLAVHTDIPREQAIKKEIASQQRQVKLRTQNILTRDMMRVLDDEIPEGQGNITIYRAACDAFDCGWDFCKVISEFASSLPWFKDVGGIDTVRSAAKKKLIPC